MSLQAGRKLAHYEILEPIGKGGMGEVYRARDTKLGRDVAIKVLPDEFAQDTERLRRFQREAKVLASLNHPGIAAIHGLEESEGTHYLILELVPGETLAERISRGPIPCEEALEIAAKIAEAVEEAHEQGIVHRDLKPANIKQTEDGKIKVLDFGLAKAFVDETRDADSSMSPTLTRDATRVGVILGTAAYMSPEQAKGKRVDKRTDIFAFGAVLYEMVTGNKAFPGEDISEVLAAVIKLEPDWSALPTSVPSHLVALVRRCLDKDQRRRVRDIGEARILLEDALAGNLAPHEPRTRQATRTPWGWMAASAALLLILAGIFLFGRDAPSNERVLRYSIPLPQGGVTFSYALSPDGRHVAFHAATGERVQIFVRALDSWDLQVLPDTSGATNLFWSPDSRYIAFFAREKLWKVALSGGPAEALCDAPGLLNARGTWGRRNAIVFALSNKYEPGPLRSVSATGGESSPLTAVASGESHRFPVFIPDGNHFLYTSVGGSKPGIYVASLDEPSGRRLLADESSAHLAPAPNARGATHLLFIRDGDLMAREFDTDRLELTGEPFLLLEDAPRQDDRAAAVSVSEDGILSYLGGRDRLTDSRFTWFDRSGNVISDEGELGPPAFASLSPDEKTMAVPLRPPGSWTTDLYLRDVTRGVDERFTFDNAVDEATNAVWSPDGSSILFSAKPSGTFDLFWKDTRSSRPAEVLLATENPKYVTDWSRDGRYVLYTELDPETQADLWYLTMENGGTANEVRAGAPATFLQTEFLESSAQLSPDGKWLAYTSDESGEVALYVRSFPSGEGKRKISTGRARQPQPRWSPDGRELFYFSGPASISTLMSVAVTRAGLGSSDGVPIFETGDPEPLFQVRANGFHPATGTFFYSVSADGQRFLINHVDNAEEPVLNVVVDWHQAFEVSRER